MSILSGIPVLNCQSIEATLDFYQQALQFVIVKKRESEGELQWVHLMNGANTHAAAYRVRFIWAGKRTIIPYQFVFLC